MSPPFSVRTTPHFDRLLRGLRRRHAEPADLFGRAVEILERDPTNRSREHNVAKPQGVDQGDGQWRLRLGRFRFRYDLYGDKVVLHYVGLRREDTYRR